MPYASHRDRDPDVLELYESPWPAAPLNLFMTSGYLPGVLDLCWSDPSQMALNSKFHILGSNVYRSFDSEFGPYDRISELPVGSTFWRDQTDNVVVQDEVVPDDYWVMRGVDSSQMGERYVFQTQNRPIVQPGSQAVPSYSPLDVMVWVDGVRAKVLSVDGSTGSVELDVSDVKDVALQQRVAVVKPSPESRVTVSYRYNRSLLRTDLAQRVFYRVTTVAVSLDKCSLGQAINPQDLVETPLERAAFTSSFEIEKIDWIWREAVRRNRWILDQGGERVKAFIRKAVGTPCPCIQWEHHHQPRNDCPRCFGVGILGGYEGPYDIIIGPDDSERKISQTEIGRTLSHVYEVWTGPTPLLSQRDFVVKVNGDRYSLGPVRMPTNRGMVLQQHFNIGHIDEKDIRYSVPIDNPYLGVVNRVVPSAPPGTSGAHVTDSQAIPDEREFRGRTLAWQNTVY